MSGWDLNGKVSKYWGSIEHTNPKIQVFLIQCKQQQRKQIWHLFCSFRDSIWEFYGGLGKCEVAWRNLLSDDSDSNLVNLYYSEQILTILNKFYPLPLQIIYVLLVVIAIYCVLFCFLNIFIFIVIITS